MAKKGKITELYDINSLEAQQKTVIGLIDVFLDKVNSAKPIKVQLEGVDKARDAIKGITELTEVTKDYVNISGAVASAQAKLSKSNKELGDSFANVGAKINSELGGSAEKAIEKLLKLSEALKANKKAQQELADQKDTFSQMNQELPDVIAGIAEITNRQKELKEQELVLRKTISDTNSEIKKRLNLSLVTPNTREEIKATIAQLKDIRDTKININTAEGQARVAELNQEIDRLSKIYEQTTDKLEKRKINIGNYTGAVKTLEAYLADVRNQLNTTRQAASASSPSFSLPTGPSIRENNAPIRAGDNNGAKQVLAYGQAAAQTAAKIDDLQKKEQLLSRIVESQLAGFASATAEIKNNEKALQALAAAGLQNTEFYQVLLKSTAELKDSVGDLKDEIAALASDTRQFDLVAGAVTGLVSLFQVGASVGELFAGSNDDIQKSIQRLTALQNIAMGIQQLANDLTTRGTALNKIYNFIIGEGAKTRQAATTATTANTIATEENAAATEVATVATTGLSVATKVLRGALIASGIGLLIAGVILLIQALEEWRDADINLIKHQAELNQVTLESIRLNKELGDLTRTDVGTDVQAIKNRIAANQAYGRSQGEVLAAEQKLLEARQLAAQTKFLDIHGFQGLVDAETELNKASIAYNEFINLQAKTPINQKGNSEKIEAQKSLLQSALDLAKETFSQRKQVVEDYVNYNNEAIAKQLQIERLNADERRKYALQSTTLSANAIIDANQRALNNDATTLKQRIALMQSTAEQQKRLAQAQNQDVQNDPGASSNEKLMAARNLQYQLSKIEKDSLEAIRKVREEYRKREAAANFEILKAGVEAQASANKELADNESESLEDRLLAARAYQKDQEILIIAQRNIELDNANLTATERKAIEDQANADLLQTRVSFLKQVKEISTSELDEESKARSNASEIERDKALKALNDRFNAGKISLQEYNKERLVLEQKYTAESLQLQIENAQKFIDSVKKRNEEIEQLELDTAFKISQTKDTATKAQLEAYLKYLSSLKVGNDQIAEQEKILAGLQKNLSDEVTSKRIDNLEKLKEKEREVAEQAVSTFETIVSASKDREINQIQEQIDALESQKQKDIEVANATIINKEEKERAVAEIELRAQNNREALEARQKQIELQKAKFERTAAVLNIAIDTFQKVAQIKSQAAVLLANPVTAALAPIALAQIPFVILGGGLATAAILAQPLPKFADGTWNAPGGLSWVGDGGNKELVVEPTGKAYKTPSTPTIMDVPKHSVIFPDADAVLRDLELVAMSNISKVLNFPINEQAYGSMMTKAIENKLETINNTIRSKRELHIQPGFNSIMALHKYGSRWNKMINEQTKF